MFTAIRTHRDTCRPVYLYTPGPQVEAVIKGPLCPAGVQGLSHCTGKDPEASGVRRPMAARLRGGGGPMAAWVKGLTHHVREGPNGYMGKGPYLPYGGGPYGCRGKEPYPPHKEKPYGCRGTESYLPHKDGPFGYKDGSPIAAGVKGPTPGALPTIHGRLQR